MAEKYENNTLQNIIIENRSKIHVSGVKEVLSFDEETVLLSSALGKITIKGDNMRISSFNTETGDLTAEGKIHAAVYMGDKSGGGFISRILK
ncbi:MAG: sporulation protein YabP [Clostridia bacterium]|nr:sporulation protein YabP [Clostridia bacterium]